MTEEVGVLFDELPPTRSGERLELVGVQVVVAAVHDVHCDTRLVQQLPVIHRPSVGVVHGDLSEVLLTDDLISDIDGRKFGPICWELPGVHHEVASGRGATSCCSEHLELLSAVTELEEGAHRAVDEARPQIRQVADLGGVHCDERHGRTVASTVRQHVRRDVDTDHGDPASLEPECDAPGADADFECSPPARMFRQEVPDSRIDGPESVPVVIEISDLASIESLIGGGSGARGHDGR